MTSLKGYILSTVVLFSLSVSGTFAQEQKVSKENYSLLWKIEGNTLQKPSYLFGTMHVRSKHAFEFSDSVLIALLKADIAAFELNLDSVMVYQFKKSIEKAEDRVLFKEIFTDDELGQIEKKTKDFGFNTGNLKNKNFRELKEFFDNLEKDKTDKMPVFLDAYLSVTASNNGITIYGLEDYEFQQKLFDSISIEQQKKLIISKTDSLPAFLDKKDEMLTIYRSGDINRILEYINKNKAFYDEDIIDKRNVTMVSSLEPLLKNNSVFTAVGAAHLPGENGIIQLLKNKGYTVTPVKATFTGVADSIMTIKKISQWSNYCDSTAGYKLEVSGKPVSYKAFGGIIDMKVCYNQMGSPSYYFYSLAAPLTSINSDSKKFLDIIFKRISNGSRASIASKKNIVYKGIKGIELKMQMSWQYEAKVRMFFVNNHVYFLMVGNNEKEYNSDEATQFFNSLTFFEPEKTKNIGTEEWQELKNSKGAFSLRFPSNPYYLNKNIPNVNDTTSEPTEIHLHTAINSKTQEIYMLRWNDLPNGYYYKNDSTVYQELFTSFLGEDYVFDPLKCKALVLNGVVGYEPYDTIQENGIHLRFRTYLRGNRVYLLIAQSKVGMQNNEAESFFNSFSLIPYLNTAYTQQGIEEMRVNLPAEAKLIDKSESSYWQVEFPTQTYSSKDQNSGSLYTIVVKTYPKYYRIAHIDSFYISLENDLIDFNDKAIDTTFGYTPNNLYYRTGTIVSGATNNRFKYWIFNKANKSFEILACVNDEIIQNQNWQTFLNTIEIGEVKADFDMYASKSALILNDIKSRDSATFEEAKQALKYYKFEKTDIKNLYNALFYNYSDSLENYSTVKSSLISIIEDKHDDKATDVLVKLYKEDPKNRSSVLDALCKIAPSNKQLIYSLLMDYKPDDIYYFQANKIFGVLSDSLSFFKTNILNMFNLTHNMDGLQRGLIDVLVSKWDTLQLNDNDKNKISNNIIEWYSQAADSISKYTPDSTQYYDFSQVLCSGISYFRKLNDAKFDNYVKRFSESDYTEFQSEVIQYNIIRKLPIKPAVWEKVLNDDYYGWNLVTTLNTSGNFAMLPKEYQTEQKLCLLALKSYFSDEEIGVEKVKVLGIRKIKKGEKELNYYIYEFIDESEEKFIAISGGIEIIRNKLNIDNQYYDFSYNSITNSKDAQKETEQLIENLKNYSEI